MSKKTVMPGKICKKNAEFCVPSFVSRFRPPFLGPPIMRTIKQGAVFRPRNRAHFYTKKPIFGQKKCGRRRPQNRKKCQQFRRQKIGDFFGEVGLSGFRQRNRVR